MRALILVAVLALAHQASAWWCNGHMFVAEVARQQMKASTLSALKPFVDNLAPSFPTSPDFTQAACWADDLKSNHLYSMGDWHYINQPYIRDQVTGAVPAASIDGNVVWAIRNSNDTMRCSTNTFSIGFQLRNLIHFVGDLHQPLHAAYMLSDAEFPAPDGDDGGNKFKIQGANVSELHAFWDSGAGLWGDSVDRPLSSTDEAWVQNTAKSLQQQFPPSFFGDRLNSHDAMEWASDTFGTAKTTAYNLQPGSTLTQSYIDAARTMAQQQVTLGGYRLANMLDAIVDAWGGSTPPGCSHALRGSSVA